MGSFDYSSLSKVLEEYPDFQKIQVMVETGTFLGRGARTASKYVREVHTIEISNEIYKDISERLQSEGYHNITVYHGNSVDILPKLIPQIKELCLFFLDAHWSGDQTVDWDGSLWKGYGRDTGHAGVNTLTPSSKEQVPLLEEFLIITEQFPHKCVLYIDDMDKFDAQGKGLKNKAFQGEDWSNLTVNKLLEALGERLYAQHNLRNQWVLLLNEKPRQTQIQDLATLSKELPNSGFNAEIVCQDSLVCIAGEPLNLKVKVKNISNSPWNNNALTLRSKYAICLGNHWLNENGKLLKWNDGRCFLEKGTDIAQQVEVTITVNPPEEPGKYHLELDMVQEAISWFAKHGSKTKKVSVIVKSTEKTSSEVIVNRILDYQEGGYKKIEGWLSRMMFDVLKAIPLIHSKLKVHGSVYEIGVHHGHFLLALNLLRNSGESCVAIDVFDKQELNTDKSGKGSLSQLETNIKRYVEPCLQDIGIVQTDYTDINTFDIIEMQKKYGRARLFSIDGGHTVENTISDLLIATQLITNGGLIFLDDYYNRHWPGVHEGFCKYMIFHTPKIAPLLYIGNKLVLTTTTYHQRLYQEFLNYFSQKPDAGITKYVKMFGHDVIVFGKVSLSSL